jgi:hypothetical protein
MTENAPTPETPAEEPGEGAAPPQGDPTPEPQAPETAAAPPDPELDLDQEGDVGKLRHEAASRRRQLRQVEAERDALRDQVDDFHRERVERLAAQRLTDGTDVWTAVELGELRDEDGALDESKVRAALDDLVQRKPHWRKPTEPLVDLHAGVRQTAPEAPSFGGDLKRALRGGR